MPRTRRIDGLIEGINKCDQIVGNVRLSHPHLISHPTSVSAIDFKACTSVEPFCQMNLFSIFLHQQDFIFLQNTNLMVFKNFKAVVLTVAMLFAHLALFTQTASGDDTPNADLLINTHLGEMQADADRPKGFTGILEAGVVVGNDNRVKLNGVGSYFVLPWLSTGLGAGLRYFNDRSVSTVPVFADLRFYPGKKRQGFYISGGAGTTFNLNDSRDNPSLFISVTVGTGIQVARRSFIHFSIGYEMEEIRTFWGYYYYARVKNKAHGANVNIGFSF
jgi:hypothetical protein